MSSLDVTNVIKIRYNHVVNIGGNLMKKTVLRKQGKDLVLDAPSELEECVGRKYNIIENADGSILYKPIEVM